MTNEFYTEKGVVFCRRIDALGFAAHGFSTREGGVSRLEYTKSMNLAYCRGDDDGTVNKNRELFAAAAGFDIGGLVTSDQTHSCRVEICDGKKKHYSGADGFVTSTPGVHVSVKTADCQPVMFADPVSRTVGICHAGWRGTMGGIAGKTADMTSARGDKNRLIAVLGPCIGPCCFEVKDDFVSEFEKNAPELLRFITGGSGVYHADISAMNRYVLLSHGLRGDNIFVCGQCTCCLENKYYSHRRQRGVRGTMMSVIGIKEAEPR